MTSFLVCLYCAIADRVRGGYPSDRFWLPGQKPWWKPPLRTTIWFLSGFVLSSYILSPSTWLEFLFCGITSILFALGERQNMGVIGWLYEGHPKQFWGWLQQFRIGGIWALLVTPAYFLNSALWVLIPACFFAPIIGAIFAKFLWVKLPREYLELDGQWAWTELFRGWFMAHIAIILHSLNVVPEPLFNILNTIKDLF